MEFFRFCLEIIRREAKRLNVGIRSSTVCQLTAATVEDINYDDGHNRCAFLYRYGTINLSFVKDCFGNFLSDSNRIEYLLTKWRLDRSLTFCSISKGPALDYIVALLLCNEQSKILTSLIGNIRIITKHGAWRNTANIMLEIINEGYFDSYSPSIRNIEVTQGDPFCNLTQKVKLPISDSDVVMMIKTQNLQNDRYDQEKVSKSIQEFLDALKPGAVLFCVDTKPSIKEITQSLTAFSGKYLLKPTLISTVINLEYRELYRAQFGCLPFVSGRGCFFVWEKSSVSTSSMKCELNDTSEPVKTTFDVADTNCDKIIVDKSRSEQTCITSLSNDLKMCIKEIAENFENSNAPKLIEKSSEVNSILRKKADYVENSNAPKLIEKSSEANSSLRKMLEDYYINSYFEKSSCPLPTDSSVNGSTLSSNQLDFVSNNSYFEKSSYPLPSDSSVNGSNYHLDSMFNISNFENSSCPLLSDSAENFENSNEANSILRKKADYVENFNTPKLIEKSSEANSSLREMYSEEANSRLRKMLEDYYVNRCFEKSSCPLPTDSSVNGSTLSSNQLDFVSNNSYFEKSSCPLPSDSSVNGSNYHLDSISNISSNFENSSCPLLSDSSVNGSIYHLDFISNTNSLEKSNYTLSSDSSVNRLISNSLNTLKSLKSGLDLMSKNICLGATPELSKETEITKITELSNKITDLRVELTKLLGNNRLNHCATANSLRCSEKIGNPLDTKSNSCSCTIPCSRLSQNFKMCCCCQKCACNHSHLSSNHISMCNKTSNCSRSSSAVRSCISAENIHSSAQIVIPLNNLSTDIVSQIISLITQPNHE